MKWPPPFPLRPLGLGLHRRSLLLGVWVSVLVLMLVGGLYTRWWVRQRLPTMLEQHMGVQVQWRSVYPTGLGSLQFHDLEVQAHKRGVTLRAEALGVRLSWWKLLQGGFPLRGVSGEGLRLEAQLAEPPPMETAQSDSIPESPDPEPAASQSPLFTPARIAQLRGMLGQVHRLIHRASDFRLRNLELHRVQLTLQQAGRQQVVRFTQFRLQQGELLVEGVHAPPSRAQASPAGPPLQQTTTDTEGETAAEAKRPADTAPTVRQRVTYRLVGSWTQEPDQRERIQLSYRRRGSANPLGSSLRTLLGAEFHAPQWTVALAWTPGDTHSLNLQVDARQTRLQHPRLSTRMLLLEQLKLDLQLASWPQGLAVNPGSSLGFGGWDYAVQGSLAVDSVLQLAASFDSDWGPAKRFFDALPPSLFPQIQGLKASGRLRHSGELALRSDSLDQLVFDLSLDSRKMQVQNWGETTLLKLRGPFDYYPARNPRRIRLGPGNPDFIPLHQASMYLRNAVQFAEDGGFYRHRGFLPDALRASLIENLKAGRFKRGGSTLSMQLVKNLFLSHRKTIGRKLQEALLVWLMERFRVASKDRLLELYLNAVEWGPNVYGASEAARFYFAKPAAALSLEESIFLAMILPRPRTWRWYFDSDGRLLEIYHNFFDVLANKFAQKGLIAQWEAEEVNPDRVRLRGEAAARFR